MNIFSRLLMFFRGMFSLLLGRAERKNPEIAYENAINKQMSNYVKLKHAGASLLAHKDSVEQRLGKEKEQLQLIAADLGRAVDENKDEAALVLIQKKDTVEKEIVRLVSELESAERSFNDTRNSLVEVKSQVDKLKTERDRVIANIRSAKIKLDIRKQLKGIGTDTDIRQLEGARDESVRLLAEVRLDDMLDEESSLDAQLRSIRNENAHADAKKKLEELKAHRTKALPPPANKTVIEATLNRTESKVKTS